MKRIVIAFALVAMVLSASFAQINVYRIGSGGNLENVDMSSKDSKKPLIFTDPSKLAGSFFYTLPLTVIKVDVDVIEKRFVKGPYSQYSDKLLGLKNIVKEDYFEYELSNVSMTTESRPDGDNYYYVEFLKNKDNRPYVASLTENGFLVQLSEQELASNSSVKESVIERNTTLAEYFKYYASSSQYEKVDTIYRTITIENEVVTKQYLTSTLTERPNEAKAKEIAESIGKIRESRLNLISGYQETSYDKNTLEYMVTELNNLEDEYISLFKGVSLSKKVRYTYYYVPSSDVTQDYVPLFKFSQTTGVADLNSMSGREVSIMVQRDNNTSKLAQFTKQIADNQKENNKAKGIYYRIPEYAEATISYMGKEMETKSMFINQFGVITTMLPSSSNMKFHTKVGSIQSVSN